MFCLVTHAKDEERNVIKKRHFAYTQTHNTVGAKRLGVLTKQIPPTSKDFLVTEISLRPRTRTRNMRPLEKYEGVKTVLVTLYAFLRKH